MVRGTYEIDRVRDFELQNRVWINKDSTICYGRRSMLGQHIEGVSGISPAITDALNEINMMRSGKINLTERRHWMNNLIQLGPNYYIDYGRFVALCERVYRVRMAYKRNLNRMLRAHNGREITFEAYYHVEPYFEETGYIDNNRFILLKIRGRWAIIFQYILTSYYNRDYHEIRQITWLGPPRYICNRGERETLPPISEIRFE